MADNELKESSPGVLSAGDETICVVFPASCQTIEEIERRKENAKKIIQLWNAHNPTESEPYQFQSGDVAEIDGRCKRIICYAVLPVKQGDIFSINAISGNVESNGQKAFERFGYKKIGELKNYIK